MPFGRLPTMILRIQVAVVVIVAIADVAFYVRAGRGDRSRSSPARQFGLFSRSGRSDAAGEALERPLFACAKASFVPRLRFG